MFYELFFSSPLKQLFHPSTQEHSVPKMSQELKKLLDKHFNDLLMISSNCYFEGIIQPVPFNQSPSGTSPFYLVFLKEYYEHLLI